MLSSVWICDIASIMRRLCLSVLMRACVNSLVCVLVCKSMFAGVRT